MTSTLRSSAICCCETPRDKSGCSASVSPSVLVRTITPGIFFVSNIPPPQALYVRPAEDCIPRKVVVACRFIYKGYGSGIYGLVRLYQLCFEKGRPAGCTLRCWPPQLTRTSHPVLISSPDRWFQNSLRLIEADDGISDSIAVSGVEVGSVVGQYSFSCRFSIAQRKLLLRKK